MDNCIRDGKVLRWSKENGMCVWTHASFIPTRKRGSFYFLKLLNILLISNDKKQICIVNIVDNASHSMI